MSYVKKTSKGQELGLGTVVFPASVASVTFGKEISSQNAAVYRRSDLVAAHGCGSQELV